MKCWLLLVTSNTSCWNGDCEGDGCKRGLCCTEGDGLGVKNGPGGDKIPKRLKNTFKIFFQNDQQSVKKFSFRIYERYLTRQPVINEITSQIILIFYRVQLSSLSNFHLRTSSLWKCHVWEFSFLSLNTRVRAATVSDQHFESHMLWWTKLNTSKKLSQLDELWIRLPFSHLDWAIVIILCHKNFKLNINN